MPDNIATQDALRFTQLTLKQKIASQYSKLIKKHGCLKIRGMEGAMLPEELGEIESIPKKLGMKPDEILRLAEKAHIPENGCQ
jgi:hypothetical protein